MIACLRDHDLHPDEPTMRVFRTPSAGVLGLDDIDKDELSRMLGRGVVSPAEGRGGERERCGARPAGRAWR